MLFTGNQRGVDLRQDTLRLRRPEATTSDLPLCQRPNRKSQKDDLGGCPHYSLIYGLCFCHSFLILWNHKNLGWFNFWISSVTNEYMYATNYEHSINLLIILIIFKIYVCPHEPLKRWQSMKYMYHLISSASSI